MLRRTINTIKDEAQRLASQGRLRRLFNNEEDISTIRKMNEMMNQALLRCLGMLSAHHVQTTTDIGARMGENHQAMGQALDRLMEVSRSDPRSLHSGLTRLLYLVRKFVPKASRLGNYCVTRVYNSVNSTF